MARRLFPKPAELWRQHEETYIDVFMLALDQLCKNACNATREDTISEMLCPILKRICFQKSRENNCEISTPDWDKPIQPATEDEIRGDKSNKKPDFTCKLVNAHAIEEEDFEVLLHVECKLLGSPTSTTWILNNNYVKNGIKRFDSKSHEYGKRASSGIMIGYIISMEPSDILKEVNSFQSKILPGYSELSLNYKGYLISQSRQRVNRTNVLPSCFELIHLWADLRNSH